MTDHDHDDLIDLIGRLERRVEYLENDLRRVADAARDAQYTADDAKRDADDAKRARGW